MKPLENARHEAYIQYLIGGMSQRQAYLTAFPNAKKWKPETVDSSFCVMQQKGIKMYVDLKKKLEESDEK